MSSNTLFINLARYCYTYFVITATLLCSPVYFDLHTDLSASVMYSALLLVTSFAFNVLYHYRDDSVLQLERARAASLVIRGLLRGADAHLLVETIACRTVAYVAGGPTVDVDLVLRLMLCAEDQLPSGPLCALCVANISELARAHAALRNNQNYSVPRGVITLGLVGTILAPITMAAHFADISHLPGSVGYASGYIAHVIVSFALFELSFANMNIHRLVPLESLCGGDDADGAYDDIEKYNDISGAGGSGEVPGVGCVDVTS